MRTTPNIHWFLWVALLAGLMLLWPLRSRVVGSAENDLDPAKIRATRTIADRLAEFGAAARLRWQSHFTAAGLSYPPQRVTLVVFKDVDELQVYAANTNGPMKFVRTIKVLAASGVTGPKLREGDHQVPEGIYPIELLNPNSRYHVSLRVGYPNTFDRAQARGEGRTNLGGDIMIHGKAVSVGCVAIGDEAAEDVFTLAADVGIEQITALLCPTDLRVKPLPALPEGLPVWYPGLVEQIRQELSRLPQPAAAPNNPPSTLNPNSR